MPQLTYRRNLAEGLPGLNLPSKASDVLSAINDDPRAQQIITFTVATGTSGVLTLNGILFEGAGADNEAVAVDLAAQINAEPLLNGSLTAEASTNTVIVTATIGGIGFTFADGAGTTAATTQANAEADPIPFGRAVLSDGEAEDGELLCKLLDANTPAAILGVSLYTATFEKPRSSSPFEDASAEYPQNSVVNVLRQGRLYVETEGTVSVGDSVYVRHTADGALDKLGGFAGDSGTGLAELTQCRWMKGTNAQGLAVLQVGFV